MSDKDIKINTEKGININPIAYIHKYLNSKGFKKRLGYIKDKSLKTQYANNIANNANSDINIVNKNNSWYNKILGIFSDSHKAKTKPESYDSMSNYITIGEFGNEQKKIAPSKDFILAHEYGHKIDPTDKAIPLFFNPYFDKSKAPYEYRQIHNNKKVEENNIHDKAYAETYADVIGTRYDLYSNGIYDSRNTIDFTEDDYNKYIDYLKTNNKHNRLIEQFDKDDFIKLINTIAQNKINSKTNNDRYSLEDIYYG